MLIYYNNFTNKKHSKVRKGAGFFVIKKVSVTFSKSTIKSFSI